MLKDIKGLVITGSLILFIYFYSIMNSIDDTPGSTIDRRIGIIFNNFMGTF